MKKNVLNLVLLILLMCLCLEIFLQISKPTVYEFSKKLGWETKKNYIRKFKFKDFYNNKYDGIYETDKFGSRKIGDLNARKKILVVGDSFTMDPHTGNQETWFSVLRDGLESIYDETFTVSAIGGGGYGTNQQYLISKEFLEKSNYEPDLVILQFCVNDFMNNSFNWETNTENYSQFLRRPFYVNNNHFIYKENILGKFMRTELASKLKLPNYFFLIYAIFERKYFESIISKHTLQESTEITLKLLIKFKNLFKTEVYAFNCKDSDFFPENQWGKVLKNAGFKVLLTPSLKMKKISNNQEIFFKDGGHYNKLGNKLLGQFVLNELIEQNLF